ncbi:MAG: hypothetical protein E3J54_05105 [Actinobacteria bacterium]|nr:MAG: hypothetical protein E3J54_05105 [Actinomycetota bacterium]
MSEGLFINLLPKDIQKKRTAEKGLIFLIAIIALFIGGLIIVSFLFGLNIKSEEDKLVTLQAQTKKLEKQIAKYEIFKERKEQIAQHEEVIGKALDDQLFWHRLLNELSMIIPNNVTINDLKLQNDGISMNGFAFNHQGVAEFIVRMNDLDELKDIWIDGSKDAEAEEVKVLGSSSDSSSSTSVVTVKGVEFTLTAKLKNPAPTDAAKTGGSAEKSTSSSKEKN